MSVLRGTIGAYAFLLLALALSGCRMTNKMLASTSAKELQPGFVSNWVSGIPANTLRSTAIPARIGSSDLAAVSRGATNCWNALQGSPVRQVSTRPHRSNENYVVEAINDVPVRNLEDVLRGSTVDSTDELVLTVRQEVSGKASKIRIETETLPLLQQSVASDVNIVNGSFAGRPTAVVREGSIRCMVSPRLDRQTGLLQLTLLTSNFGVEQCVMPRDLRVSWVKNC